MINRDGENIAAFGVTAMLEEV